MKNRMDYEMKKAVQMRTKEIIINRLIQLCKGIIKYKITEIIINLMMIYI